MKSYNVAIVGASGAVGQELIRVLSLRNFPVKKLTLLASKRSAGKTIDSEFGSLTIEEFSEDSFTGKDFVFFATSGEHSKKYAPLAAEAGAVVIDNSSAFRLDDNVPLVVPEVNPEAAKNHNGIIANPNCSTIQMVVALNPIHRFSKIKRVVVSTYQAVSGAGQDAVRELNEQLRAVLAGESAAVENFTKQIAFNVIPHIDVFQENGYTKEEMKMVNETWKIMGDANIRIAANCVRVPVIRAHSEAINIETEEFVGVEKARELLASSEGINVVDQREDGGYPTPVEVSETMETNVGRIREDISCENGLAFWVVADQLWKGAALNAVQIAELLINNE
ncbi:aspartate-semialdehyde dehydrogenase [Aliikangiella coralliicola]|uniref:Aspartate-semialdehyde dehydrogenase n=1 Tax=Aliikangiella coralliicola TaxID=2592383 RepID=A0A545TZW4_9GAMM|nr:aspartate-semialdehyde dehydrogenase [Aliikangiella coralliicola]TQV82758.1 aspartate-semialdehyde dehydrogenase [Aliikangiella coralliicola]